MTELEFQRDRHTCRQVGALLVDAFTAPGDVRDRAQLARTAHWGDAPITRLLERDRAGAVVGHVSLFFIEHDGPPNHRVLGIGDLVVHPANRGRGVAQRLVKQAVRHADQRHGAQVIFARSTSVADVFMRHGFKRTRSRALSELPGWLAWSKTGRLAHYGRLEPNDF